MRRIALERNSYLQFTIYNHVNDICRLGQVSKVDMTCGTEPGIGILGLVTKVSRYFGTPLYIHLVNSQLQLLHF